MTPLRKGIAITAGVVIVLLIIASIFASRLQPWARETLISSLQQRYKADVELGDLKISLLPLPRVSGDNLVLRPHGAQPMIRIRHFSAGVLGLKHVGTVTLDGLDIKLPAHREHTDSGSSGKSSVTVDEVIANNSRLATTPQDPAKEPLVFDIQRLTLRRTGSEDAMNYHAELINPRPKGAIVADGTFGPWNADDPSSSPIEGKYTFRNADLSTFKGISGMLNSDGRFKGQVDSIEAQGNVDVADFALKAAGHPLPLHTTFSATIDGTSGVTVLHSVPARLGKSEFQVSGSIEPHKTISLKVSGEASHLEDFLTLAMKTPKAPMTGTLRFAATIGIPSRDVDMIDRLELDGSYDVDRVKFTSPDIEQKISGLSHRAEGDPENRATGTQAAFSGHYKLRDGVMRLPDISFRIPGAAIGLAGTYQMRGSSLDFSGTAKMDATISQMTTGVKKILLKPVDPLFKRNDAGAVVPIKISGTPGKPSFALDIGRALRK